MNENRATRTTGKGMFSFDRHYPRACLRPFIRNYWSLGPISRPGALSRLRIVPDGFTDVIFVRRSSGEAFQAAVVGTMTKPIFEELSGHVEYVGIRFAPGGFTGLFGVPADELTDRIVPLESVTTPFISLHRMAEDMGVQARLALVEDALDGRLASQECDAVFATVIETIFAHRGAVSVAQLARIAGWSPRHLHRTFRGLVGVGPKNFCRIVRFKTALRMLRHGRQPNLLDVALDAGYYDQAHFIHDFNGFYGASPSTVLKKPGY